MTLKPVIKGLIDRQGEPAKSVQSAVRAYVVKTDWATLQPIQGGPIAGNNPIDAALARVRDPKSPVHGLALKLRVFAGVQAPDWAKHCGGAPINYVSTPDQTAQKGTLGRFWTSAYIAAYADLQAKLAALYDSAPEIRELTLSAPCTFFDEPMVRNPVPANTTALKLAGYTTAADQSAFTAAIAAHDVWQHTATDIDFSPFPIVGTGNDDMPFTIDMIDHARNVLGARAGLQNNALSTDKLSNTQFTQLYQAMHTAGGTIVFQTAAKQRLGDPVQTLDAALTYGAHSVELPQGYPQIWTLTQLQQFNTALQ
jgi:hypothetical protein